MTKPFLRQEKGIELTCNIIHDTRVFFLLFGSIDIYLCKITIKNSLIRLYNKGVLYDR